MIKESHPTLDRGYGMMSGAIHEFGHTLGLFADDHNGIDNRGATIPLSKQWFKYRNYRSIMNYLYTYRIYDYSDGTHGFGDYNDWANLEFTFFKNTHFEWPKIS